MFEPVSKQSLSQAVYEQLRDRILSGEMEVGSSLPAERRLCELLEVNRGAVREALQRLAQARLISIQHGGATRVLDYQRHGGLDLLSELFIDAHGQPDLTVARSVVEMKTAIAPDIARFAALRATPQEAEEVAELSRQIEAQADDLEQLQQLSLEFWHRVVGASGNVAYKLAFNALRCAYEKIAPSLMQVMEPELSDIDSYTAIAEAVLGGDGAGAEEAARGLVQKGQRSFEILFDAIAEEL